MSKIISKPFNKSKRILRAIFQGSPNLFTTSDLNRQIESFERRLNDIETYLSSGVTSDLQFTITESEGYALGYSLSYLELFGCVLHSGQEISGVLMEGDWNTADTKEVRLWYKTRRVTYSDDTTHDISGVKFEDGTSKAAADHLVIDSWGIVVGADIPSGSESLLLCEGFQLLTSEEDPSILSGVTYTAHWRQRHSTSLEHKIRTESKVAKDYTDSQVENLRKSLSAKEYIASYTSPTSPSFSVEMAIRYNGYYGYLDVKITDIHLAGSYEISLQSTQFSAGYNTTQEEFTAAWRWAWTNCGIANATRPFFFGGTPDGTWVSFGRNTSFAFTLKTSTTQSREGEYYLRIPLLPKSYIG